jgi:hypothetical protein
MELHKNNSLMTKIKIFANTQNLIVKKKTSKTVFQLLENLLPEFLLVDLKKIKVPHKPLIS